MVVRLDRSEQGWRVVDVRGVNEVREGAAASSSEEANVCDFGKPAPSGIFLGNENPQVLLQVEFLRDTA